jgi:hypothetical protein
MGTGASNQVAHSPGTESWACLVWLQTRVSRQSQHALNDHIANPGQKILRLSRALNTRHLQDHRSQHSAWFRVKERIQCAYEGGRKCVHEDPMSNTMNAVPGVSHLLTVVMHLPSYVHAHEPLSANTCPFYSAVNKMRVTLR